MRMARDRGKKREGRIPVHYRRGERGAVCHLLFHSFSEGSTRLRKGEIGGRPGCQGNMQPTGEGEGWYVSRPLLEKKKGNAHRGCCGKKKKQMSLWKEGEKGTKSCRAIYLGLKVGKENAFSFGMLSHRGRGGVDSLLLTLLH